MKTKLEAMLKAYREGERGPIEYHELANLLVEQGDGRVYLDAVDAAAAHTMQQDALYPRHVTFKAVAVQTVAVPDGDTRTAVIKDAVNRFLGWKLPKDFDPDCGISFNPMEASGGSWPIGTSLFTADQAKAMFEHCIAAIAAKAAS